MFNPKIKQIITVIISTNNNKGQPNSNEIRAILENSEIGVTRI